MYFCRKGRVLSEKNEIFWHILPLGGWGLTQSKRILSEKTKTFSPERGEGDLGQSKKNLSEKLVLANSQLGGWRRGLPFLEESKQKTVLYAALNGLIFGAISLF